LERDESLADEVHCHIPPLMKTFLQHVQLVIDLIDLLLDLVEALVDVPLILCHLDRWIIGLCALLVQVVEHLLIDQYVSLLLAS
jgi:hypothetical protein